MARRRVLGGLLLAAAGVVPLAQVAFQQLPGSRGASNLRGREVARHYADEGDELIWPSVAQEPQWPRREVDRELLHPVFRLGLLDDATVGNLLRRVQDGEPAAISSLLLLGVAALVALVLSPLAVPLLVLFRKQLWAGETAASKAEHQAEFDSAIASYRQHQRMLVERLIAAREPGAARDAWLPPSGAHRVVVVTMATGQEGSAVVRALATSPAHAGTVVRALVRDPKSAKARALAALSPRVEVVACDSTDVSSLRRALEGAQAAYLCTTLNSAPAGTWAMSWEGGQYELRQGAAFAEAARGVPGLQQVIYGAPPLRKWPDSFMVEPPIHYACKWRIESMLNAAGLPVTFLRKCPYHENFTKLTKLEFEPAQLASRAAVKPGDYAIKALTPPSFAYNMMDPRDIGPWALIALEHPSLLVGESLSVAADCLTGAEMAAEATAAGAFGEGVSFHYRQQPRWLFEALSWVEPTFVYISGLQRWNSDGGAYDLTKEDVEHLRQLHQGTRWQEHLRREGLNQFTATMAELLPDAARAL